MRAGGVRRWRDLLAKCCGTGKSAACFVCERAHVAAVCQWRDELANCFPPPVTLTGGAAPPGASGLRASLAPSLLTAEEDGHVQDLLDDGNARGICGQE